VVVGVGVLGLVALLGGPVTDSYGLVSRSLLVPMAVVAVLGGGPVTAAVLRLADREGPGPGGVEDAARVLRGGAWIGSFERAGVFAALVAGWPEGMAVVLALKGLGRYSELKSEGAGTTAGGPTGGVAERFIIGTFCSVLWAVACAGVVVGLIVG
jgi:hypothetical protein